MAPHRSSSRVPTAPEDERRCGPVSRIPFKSRWFPPPGSAYGGSSKLGSSGELRPGRGRWGTGSPRGGAVQETQGRALLKPCQCLLEDQGSLHTLAWSLMLAPLGARSFSALAEEGWGWVGVQEEGGGGPGLCPWPDSHAALRVLSLLPRPRRHGPFLRLGLEAAFTFRSHSPPPFSLSAK